MPPPKRLRGTILREVCALEGFDSSWFIVLLSVDILLCILDMWARLVPWEGGGDIDSSRRWRR